MCPESGAQGRHGSSGGAGGRSPGAGGSWSLLWVWSTLDLALHAGRGLENIGEVGQCLEVETGQDSLDWVLVENSSWRVRLLGGYRPCWSHRGPACSPGLPGPSTELGVVPDPDTTVLVTLGLSSISEFLLSSALDKEHHEGLRALRKGVNACNTETRAQSPPSSSRPRSVSGGCPRPSLTFTSPALGP